MIGVDFNMIAVRKGYFLRQSRGEKQARISAYKVEGLMKQVFRGAILALLAVLIVPGRAPAGVLEFGMGARAVAMGQAQVAAVNDASAMTYNPAALSYMRDYWDLRTRQYFLQVASVGTDSILYLNDREQRDPYTSAFTIGIVLPLTRKLTGGIQVYYPQDTTIELEFFRGPTLSRYRAWRWFYVIAGGSYQITRKLSVGAGMNATLNFNSSPLNLDLTSVIALIGLDIGGGAKDLNPAFKIDVLLKQSYELGALYRPTKWLNLGAFYRYKLGTEFNIPIKIPAGLTPETNILISGYMYVLNPPQWAFGAAVFPTKNLTLAFDMQYDMWSKVTPGVKITSDSPTFSSPKENFKLDNVWWPKFGVEWKDKLGGKYSRSDYAVRLGYSHYTSPYPDKIPASGDMDTDADFFSGGFSFGYKPRRTLDYVSLDYFYQYVNLVERNIKHIDQNPPSLIADGHVIYTGFGVTIML